jgi:hypothetical protein
MKARINGCTEYHFSSFDDLTAIFNAFGRRKIYKLNLSDNQITTIPENVFDSLVSIKYLDLSNNDIKSIPNSMFSLTSLTRLDISYNKLRYLCSAFNRMPYLKRLILDHNRICGIAYDAFKYMTYIRYIDLSYNHLREYHFPYDAFSSKIWLRRLDLSHNQLARIPLLNESNERKLMINIDYNHFHSYPDLPSNVSVYGACSQKVFKCLPDDKNVSCVISHEEIEYGDEFRMCTNPTVPHVYLNEMWQEWVKTSKRVACAMCINFNVSDVVYTRI